MDELRQKQDLRREKRRLRRSLSENQQDDAARGLVNNLMTVKSFVQARRISLSIFANSFWLMFGFLVNALTRITSLSSIFKLSFNIVSQMPISL